MNLLALDHRYPFSIEIAAILPGLPTLFIDDAKGVYTVCSAALVVIALVTRLVSFAGYIRGKRWRKRVNEREPADRVLLEDEEGS